MPAHPSFRAYVGCYTTPERCGRGDGIEVFAFADASDAWTRVQKVETHDNPSFLDFDRTGRFVCAIHGDHRAISSYRIDDATGRLSPTHRTDTGGVNPVHLVFDPTNRFVIVPNYASGSVASLPFDAESGRFGAPIDVVNLSGEAGPHKVEQPGSHPHHTVFDPAARFLYVPDKGLDRVFAFAVAEDGRLRLAGETRTRAGAGPRHIVFHPRLPTAYVVNELDCTVTAYRHDRESGGLEPFRILSALPASYTGDGRAAAIGMLPDGSALIATVRGADLLALFMIDQKDGSARFAGARACIGRTPRFLSVQPEMGAILVAHEGSDSIARRPLDASLEDACAPCAVTGSPSTVLVRRVAAS